jgi:GNAT superfamily N-acetyltransferase
VSIRPAMAGDVEFLTEMLVAAVNWKPGRDLTRRQVLADPVLARYVEGWQRPEDLGVVAEDPSNGRPVAAAWVRLLNSDNPGHGYVADDIPELAIAVVAPWRSRGVGRRMLGALHAAASRRRFSAISLSVGHGNPAAHLYTAMGYQIAGSHGDDDIMLLTLNS